MNLNWLVQDSKGQYYPLETLNLSDPHFTNLNGVYMIWHGGTQQMKPGVVRVGQGAIADRLKQHRTDSTILAYRPYGLYVTWSHVPALYMNGVERHLAETWTPKVGDRFPNVLSITVNSPW